MPDLSRPKGTRDFSPEESETRRLVEETMRRAAESFGYREIRTPTFEHLDLFTAKSGAGITKQLYDFKDKAGRDLTLRPELTAPAMRYYFAEHSKSPKPVKWYYFGPCYRYEEPQSGRFREFWQFGIECIGSDRPEANAEVVAVAANILTRVGLAEFELRVGHVGVVKHAIRGLDVTDAKRAELFRLVDKKDASLAPALEAVGVDDAVRDAIVHFTRDPIEVAPAADPAAFAAAIERTLGEVAVLGPETVAAVEALRDVAALLPSFGVERFHLDLGVVRGLDYYTGVVFEAHHPKLGAESQVCGGGAYQLQDLFGAEDVGSIGFGMGFDRVCLALGHEGRLPEALGGLDAFIAPIGKDERVRNEAIVLARDLRAAGLRVESDLMGRSPSKCLDYANAKGIPHVLILGEKELAQGVVAVKDMKSGEQTMVERAKLAPTLMAKRPGDWVVT